MNKTIADRPEEFRYLILALQRQGNRQLNKLFAQLDLTNSQAEAIEVIGTYGPMSTREVGDYLVCESGSPSRLLTTLASKGLTMTSQSTTDKRATLHALTPAGREMVASITNLKKNFDDSIGDALTHALSAHPDDILTQLTCLLTDPSLSAAMKKRYPHLFDKL
ncbi:MarR family winged helix-turn-helix transcriptional regulator [Corynebacterium propinquum]|uniref:MarR family winged helix-turn-helix transcriptional regulator n=1 Tax=Corynebacterium propinquum TaxID=43769 RepID=UPI0011C76CCB|nr:MarR family transcriptional regulator [Corynebacterium propinquum]